MLASLVALGVVAGLLTSLAGQGGGLFLLLVISAVWGPHMALVLTSPALLLGNLHRSFMGRHEIDRPIATRMALAVFPGSVVGGMLAGRIPERAISVLLVVIVVLSILKAKGFIKLRVPPQALLVIGFGIGVITGASGGAGVLVGPILLSLGLSGMRYVATNSAIAVAIHVGRVGAYGASGMFRRDLVWPILFLACAIFVGNGCSTFVRPRMSATAVVRLEWGTLIVCSLISIAGIVR